MDSRVSKGCILSVIVTLILTLFALTPTYANAETTNTSLKLICKTDSVVLSNMEWSIYKVSSSKFEGYYMLDGDFESYPVSLEDIYETSKMLDTANTLESYTITDNIKPVSSGTTNQNGEVTFGDLEIGLYLVSGKPVVIDDKKYTPSAMLIEVTENHETAFQLTSYPKFNVKTLLNKDVDYIVTKVWLNERNADNSRPQDVILHLYRDGEFFEEIILNDDNDWKYTWSALDTYDWRIKEIQIPENYIVVYANDETDYLVVNNYSEETYNRMVQFSFSQQSISYTYPDVTTASVDTNTTDITGTNPNGSDTGSVTVPIDNSNRYEVSTVTNGTGTEVSSSENGGTTITDISNPNGSGSVYDSNNSNSDSNNSNNSVSGTDSDTYNDSNTTNIDGSNGGTNSPSGSNSLDTNADISNNNSVTGTNTDVLNGNVNNTDNQAGSSTNGKGSNSGATSTVDNVDKLPQTGQVWFPVPILMLCGIVCISIGLQVNSKKQ